MNKQITAAERKAIEVLLKENYTPSSIAKKLGFHRSTILRHKRHRTPPKKHCQITISEELEKGTP